MEECGARCAALGAGYTDKMKFLNYLNDQS